MWLNISMLNFELDNKISGVYCEAKNTPRVAIVLNIAINNPEKIAGTYSLMNRLLLQGTKNYSSEELANLLDKNAIELNTDMKQDYLRFKAVCLNEDIDLAIELLTEILKNSTFEEFEKEVIKMKGEIVAELDSARTKAFDAFSKNLYKNHFYGNTYTVILENIDKITKEDVINSYKEIIESGKKVISVAGDIDFERIKSALNKNLGNISNNQVKERNITVPELKKSEIVNIVKEDAQQAQIIQGWIIPTIYSEDFPALALLNNILGASGLSSRLFLELREKKGLAYHVRSTCESKQSCGSFSIYIATEPKNIKVALEGFEEEIKKLKTIPVTQKEIEDAANNIFGKQAFVTETNSQKVNVIANYGIFGLGFDYQKEMNRRIKEVKVEDIQRVANKYFNDKHLTVVLSPEKI